MQENEEYNAQATPKDADYSGWACSYDPFMRQ